MVSFKTFLAEVHAKQGGIYEQQIQAKLSRAGLAPANLQTAGSGHGADAQMYTKSGKPYGVEVKLSPNVFAGQKNLIYTKGGKANWKNEDALTAFYNEINLIQDFVIPLYKNDIEKRIKIINDFFKKHKINQKVTGFPTKMTNLQYTLLRQEFSNYVPELGTVQPKDLIKAIFANYRQKNVFYVQVGTNAGGFYYLEKDPLGLAKYGVPQFMPSEVKIRTRLKWGGSTLTPEEMKTTKAQESQSISLNTGLIVSGLDPSAVSIDGDLTFLKKGLGYIK